MTNSKSKGSKASQKGGSGKGHTDPLLDAVVQGIEANVAEYFEQAHKKGMTKAQAQAEMEKQAAAAAAKLQELTLGPQTHNISAAQQEQFRQALMAQREAENRAVAAARYINEEKPIADCYTSWMEAGPKRWVRFSQFDGSNDVMDAVVSLYDSELSEPYSSFTYQYFVFQWPDLCILAYGVESETQPAATEKGEFIGAIVSRLSRKAPGRPLRGYIAMLAVKPTFRGARIGSRLVEATVELMQRKGGEVVTLETPKGNERALKLYTGLGFAKSKFLTSYYLDGSDAFRLKLNLLPQQQHISSAADNGSSDAALSAPPALEPTA